MKQILRFQSEQEFQSFFGQLASADISGFSAVEGSGGDGGFDGLSGTTAYQSFFPEEKNRTARKYIEKIDEDVQKVVTNKEKLGLEITEWVLVVPEDLRIEVVAHLQKKSKETGITCSYWGATKLLELITKYPHIQDSFPTIFLPPVRDGIEDIKSTLSQGQKPRVLTTVDVIGDREYQQKRASITQEYRNKITSFVGAHGTASSAHLAADRIYKEEADNQLKELQLKKEKSDKAYLLEVDEQNDFYDSEVKRVNDEMARRGLSSSGIKDQAIGQVEIQRNRALERLKLKFGKD